MGLVDYSESESDSEAPQKAPAPKTQPGKKPFQKVVDRSNPGKILVNLPQESASAPKPDEPPAKRARTGNENGGRFSGFNSFLPAPKNANKKPASATASSSGQPRSKPGVNLRTSAAPGFSRDGGDDDDVYGDVRDTAATESFAPPKKQAAPSIPEEQKAAEDVKLVGKPMMFRPLSVSRNANKKKKLPKSLPAQTPDSAAQTATEPPQANAPAPTTESTEPPPKKKVSLFSMHTEEPSEPSTASAGGAYQPLFETQSSLEDEYAQYAALNQSGPMPTAGTGADSLDNIADDLNLSAAQKRELFGRGGGDGRTAKNVINFNMDQEYKHNEALRASGEEQIHNPVRAIQGGGKHSLKQLVSNAQSQRDAYEDSFAKGKSKQKEAASRYGW